MLKCFSPVSNSHWIRNIPLSEYIRGSVPKVVLALGAAVKSVSNTVSPVSISEIFTVPRTLFFELDEKDAAVLQSHFLLCMEENSRTEPDRIYLKHLIACVFLWILRHVPALEPGNTDLTNGIQTALLYLHMHFRENPGLREAAEVAHYNVSHFSTTFHKQMKMPYSTYLNLLKLSYAKELLLSTDLKISDICFECGFTSQSNFLRLFKEQTGVTPSQFRGE